MPFTPRTLRPVPVELPKAEPVVAKLSVPVTFPDVMSMSVYTAKFDAIAAVGTTYNGAHSDIKTKVYQTYNRYGDITTINGRQFIKIGDVSVRLYPAVTKIQLVDSKFDITTTIT